ASICSVFSGSDGGNRSADEHGHLKIYLPKKLLECLPKCTSLPKERHRWNTNEEACWLAGAAIESMWPSQLIITPTHSCLIVLAAPGICHNWIL
ncbi:hypothetical protein L3Q82_015922, partial [Scortum barcoo]